MYMYYKNYHMTRLPRAHPQYMRSQTGCIASWLDEPISVHHLAEPPTTRWGYARKVKNTEIHGHRRTVGLKVKTASLAFLFHSSDTRVEYFFCNSCNYS